MASYSCLVLAVKYVKYTNKPTIKIKIKNNNLFIVRISTSLGNSLSVINEIIKSWRVLRHENYVFNLYTLLIEQFKCDLFDQSFNFAGLIREF